MVDYGLLALLTLQGMILIGVSVYFVRLQFNVQRIRDAEIGYRHTAESQKEKIERLEKNYERHRDAVNKKLEEKLDYELADDKLKAEIKRCSSRISYVSKTCEARHAGDEELEQDPVPEGPVMYDPSAQTTPASAPGRNGTFGKTL